ncbi:MAG: type II toxin-antitoxin system prevent-host-death family antitoxin [Coriobacteriales bacterium]|nr:type II toxin-antitoxin system prevent-host-death family antitoxin [Coriobacteriales bacterium]
MDCMSIYEAKTGFSALIDKVQKGSTVLITKRGEAVAKIVPLSTADNKRKLGLMSLPELPDSFFEPLPEEELGLWGV